MRDRLLIPLFLPLLTAGAILLSIFAFGTVLLEVQESGQAWPVAIIAATAILLVGTVIAVQPKLEGLPLYLMTALPAAVILAIGLFFLVRPSGEGSGSPAIAAIPAPGPLEEVALDNKFQPATFTIVAAQQYTLNLKNSGQAQHNWHVLNVTGADGKPITTSLLAAGASETVNFTIDAPGTYKVQCDVHPAEMTGQLTVVDASAAAGAAPAGGGQAGPGTIVNVATDNKFAPVQLNANANEATKLTLQNRGQALHNLHILNVKGADGKDVATQILPAGQSETITFTLATAGTYDFNCDVHPVEMRGKITVK